ncbi:MAG: hypothetical protein JRL30_22125 [Deltaproteobacteria bacterium]|nr:hypothetical protein [Deltaproteobacteria bacterium]
MDNDCFYEYQPNAYGDGILLDEYRNEFSLVAAKRKDGKTYMEWVFPQKRDGSKEPIDKSLPWKIKLGSRDEAIKVLRFFLAKLEGEAPRSNDTPIQYPPDDAPVDDDVPF